MRDVFFKLIRFMRCLMTQRNIYFDWMSNVIYWRWLEINWHYESLYHCNSMKDLIGNKSSCGFTKFYGREPVTVFVDIPFDEGKTRICERKLQEIICGQNRNKKFDWNTQNFSNCNFERLDITTWRPQYFSYRIQPSIVFIPQTCLDRPDIKPHPN